MTLALYGIKNCDTMKKAIRWLEEHGCAFEFHDYKKRGVDEGVLRAAIAQHGWSAALNRRGTTWRKLPDEVKDAMDDALALQVAVDHPSIIKRPLLVYADGIFLGFSAADYERIISS